MALPILLAAKSFLTLRNVTIIAFISLIVTMYGGYLYFDAKVSKLEKIVAENNLKIAELQNSNTLCNIEVDQNNATIEVLKRNSDALKKQLQANERICNETINDLIKNCTILGGATNECINPEEVPSIDKESSKKAIDLLNKQYGDLNR